jgi:2-oxoglutarate ferredoxin oxidoreductase subunit beta
MSLSSSTPLVIEKLTRQMLKSKHPTWCPGCGDHSVLGAYFKLLESNRYRHEQIVTLAGIGCSSRFPYFVNTHGGHFLHGRSLPFASGVSLSRPDLKVFVFGGDGDGFSIGGNHLDHTARKNFNMTYVIMDNFVYGMTKNQTSPTSPRGYVSKTDPTGALDEPINPMKRLVACGATFVARTHASQMKHMSEMIERAADHNGFAVVEVLSECAHFYKGAMDGANPRREGGSFTLIPESHDATDAAAAYALANEPWPGVFGVFYEVSLPTKGEREQSAINQIQSIHGTDGKAYLKRTLESMR